MLNGFGKIFNFRGNNIDVYDQAVFVLKYTSLHYKEINKTNIGKPLAADQRRSLHFLSFLMAVHPNQEYPKYKHSCMNFRDYVQLPRDTYGIGSSIDTQIINTPDDISVHLSTFNNGI